MHVDGPSTGRSASLAERLWGLDWNSSFPLNMPNDISVAPCDWQTFVTFTTRHFGSIFGRPNPDTSFAWMEHHPAKAAWYQTVGDFFAFRQNDKMLGAFVGNVGDWGTYYLRSVGFLPELTQRGVWITFLTHLLSCLAQHGLQRAEAEVAPTNVKSLKALERLGFLVTGYRTSERWGALCILTKFFTPTHARAFHRQFCVFAPDQGHGPESSSTP
jgi:RimJ/RimL family protein N-acetyltransferase